MTPAPRPAPPSRTLLGLIAMPLFMATLDQSILLTAIPQIAADIGRSPADLSLVVSCNMLAILASMPVTGWLTQRFGAKAVFVAAIAVFGVGALISAQSGTLIALCTGRIVQGLGGGLMAPAARIVLQEEVPKGALLRAMAWFTLPVVLGPMLGPALGGAILAVGRWPMIFLVNVPVAALAGVLGLVMLRKRVGSATRQRFDLIGYMLAFGGLAMLLGAVSFLSPGGGLDGRPGLVAAMGTAGAACLWLYRGHARRHSAPLLSLESLQDDAYRKVLLSGFFFRLGTSALPFLCSIGLQVRHGYSPERAGLILSVLGAGALCAKPVTATLLNRFGYRAMLCFNSVVVAALLIVVAALLEVSSVPLPLLAAALGLSGFLRSVQFTSLNSLHYESIPPGKLSSATTIGSIVQQLSVGLGVVISGLLMSLLDGSPHDASAALAGIAALTLLSLIWLWRLPPGAGRDLLDR